jgi:purine-binding chemotaxis protein CheW
MIQLLGFRLEERSYALPLSAVERVVRAVDILPLPKAPPIVLGIINMGGRIIPAVNMRPRLGLPDRGMEPADQIIIGHTPKRTVALVVEEVSGVLERPAREVVPAEEILPGLEGVHGVVRLEDGMVLISDLHKFLSLEEEAALDEALAGVQTRDAPPTF